jgi:hypothetical protein
MRIAVLDVGREIQILTPTLAAGSNLCYNLLYDI